jgi:hypothetical protein
MERGEVNISAVGLIYNPCVYLIYEWSEEIGTDQGERGRGRNVPRNRARYQGHHLNESMEGVYGERFRDRDRRTGTTSVNTGSPKHRFTRKELNS